MLNNEVEPEIGRSAESPAATAPPKIVMQRTGDKNLNRYRPLTSKIVNETEHTIKMSNGAVLINSGVAFRKITTPKKRAPGAVRAPPTPHEVKRKMMTTQPSSSRGTQSSSKGTLSKRRRNTEGDDYSDSDEDDDLSLTAKRMLVRAAPALEANRSPRDVQTTTGTQGA